MTVSPGIFIKQCLREGQITDVHAVTAVTPLPPTRTTDPTGGEHETVNGRSANGRSVRNLRQSPLRNPSRAETYAKPVPHAQTDTSHRDARSSLAAQTLQQLGVAGGCALDDRRRQHRRRALAVPVCGEPVPHELLVERLDAAC